MLTTDDLISTTFTTTRLREGYETSEVDEFLVHTTEVLRHRDQEIHTLRDQVDAGCSTCKDGTPTTPGTGLVEGSRAAARLLEIATRNADELVGEAKAEAASLVATARADADRLTAASQAEADRLTTSARAEADQILAAAREEAERVHADLEQRRVQETADLDRHRTTVMTEVTERKAALEAEVSRLQQLEQDHRDRMRSYLNQQLEQLEPATAG